MAAKAVQKGERKNVATLAVSQQNAKKIGCKAMIGCIVMKINIFGASGSAFNYVGESTGAGAWLSRF
jgi:hypothetical protein